MEKLKQQWWHCLSARIGRTVCFSKKRKKPLKNNGNKHMSLNADYALFKVLLTDNQSFIGVSIRILKH
ncbi:MAG: hypothetical protein JWQ57_1409 [Mucilaginibacter sp.]|nr:hypothetical protein [Mucilaginibacter sp.]